MRLYIYIYVGLIFYSCSNKQSESETNIDSNNLESVVLYYQDSTVKESVQKKNGLLEGKAFRFNEDGTKAWEFNFAKDQQEGIQYYYIHGRLSFEVPYSNNKRNGWAKRYNGPCGSISEEGNYTDDKINGLWYEYYDGELLEISSFKNDSLIKVIYRNKKYSDPPPPLSKDCGEIWHSGEV